MLAAPCLHDTAWAQQACAPTVQRHGMGAASMLPYGATTWHGRSKHAPVRCHHTSIWVSGKSFISGTGATASLMNMSRQAIYMAFK